VANGTDKDNDDLHQDCMEVRPYEEDFTTPTKEAGSADCMMKGNPPSTIGGKKLPRKLHLNLLCEHYIFNNMQL
jgi:hypothetical protein